MIHISNDPLSTRDRTVVVTVMKRNEEPLIKKLKPGEMVSVEAADLVSVFDVPVR